MRCVCVCESTMDTNPSFVKLTLGRTDGAEGTPRTYRVLVACHTSAFKDGKRGGHDHWQAPIIERESALLRAGRPIVYETIDVLPGATHRASVLHSSDWVQRHRGQYDAVWAPDCGGQWFQMFAMREAAADAGTRDRATGELMDKLFAEELKSMIASLFSLVTPGGRLYLGKILMERELFAALLLSLGKAIPEVDTITLSEFDLYGAADLEYVVISKEEDGAP